MEAIVQSESQIHLASNAPLQKVRNMSSSSNTYLTIMRSIMDNGGIGDVIYVVGLFETERKAVLAGNLETHRRANLAYGGRYKAEVVRMTLNKLHTPIDIQSIEDMFYQG